MDEKGLAIGGGKVAERKIESLLRCNADVTLVSPSITKGLEEMITKGTIHYINRLYQSIDLENCFIVISACNDKNTNKQIAKACHQKNILVPCNI